MADVHHIARPYAKAAFEYAKAHGTVDAWQACLDTMAAWLSDPDTHSLLNHPQIPATVLVDALIEEYGKKLLPHEQNFLRLLGENNRLAVLPAIAQRFDEYVAEEVDRLDVRLVSAFPLTKKLTSDIEKTLSTTLNSKNLVLETDVDDSLLGGALLHVGDKVIDGSLKGQLAEMAKNLVS